MNFIITFIILSIINVVFSTVRSILTIKGGAILTSLISGLYFAYYNIMILYTVIDFPMWQKCIITFACNVIGVYLVKRGEEKMRKDKLWEVRATIPNENVDDVIVDLKRKELPFNYIEGVGPYTLFNIYCPTQKESADTREVLNQYGVKYFVSESKTL